MFCPNCGTKNEDGALFCASCGTRLVTPTAPAQGNPQAANGTYAAPQPAARKTVNPFMIASIIEICVLFIAIIAFFKIGQMTFSYRKTAVNYVKALAAADWDTVYNELDLNDSQYINQDLFQKTAGQWSATDLSNVSVESSSATKNEAYVEVKYTEKGQPYPSYVTVHLIKQPRKAFFLFDRWKINPSMYVAENVTVMVPKGAVLSLDDTEVSGQYLTDSDDPNYDNYTFDSLFIGTHKVSFEIDDLVANSDYIEVTNDYDFFTEDSITLSEAQQKELIGTAYSNMQKLITAADQAEGFNAVESLYTDNVCQDAKSSFEYLEESFVSKKNKTGILDVSIYDVTGSYFNPYLEQGKICAAVNLSYNYDVLYKEQDWWTGDYEKDTCKDQANTIDFYFIYEDGEWKLNSSQMPRFYYY
ncbi:MAG: zinc-ribbon domain-containing protein [Lachnospiraceae bacterium]|nr:zinc-ribbon domain-containing protein [Lachnospiraceae bacterium]